MTLNEILGILKDSGELAEALGSPWRGEPAENPTQQTIRTLIESHYEPLSHAVSDDDLRMMMHLQDARECQPKFLIREAHEDIDYFDDFERSKLLREFDDRLGNLKMHGLLCDGAPGRVRISHLGKNLLRSLSAKRALPQERQQPVPKAFIGSSTEGLRIAQKLQALLRADLRIVVWNQGTTFGLGDVTIEALEKAVHEYSIAMICNSILGEPSEHGAGDQRWMPRCQRSGDWRWSRARQH